MRGASPSPACKTAGDSDSKRASVSIPFFLAGTIGTPSINPKIESHKTGQCARFTTRGGDSRRWGSKTLPHRAVHYPWRRFPTRGCRFATPCAHPTPREGVPSLGGIYRYAAGCSANEQGRGCGVDSRCSARERKQTQHVVLRGGVCTIKYGGAPRMSLNCPPDTIC